MGGIPRELALHIRENHDKIGKKPHAKHWHHDKGKLQGMGIFVHPHPLPRRGEVWALILIFNKKL